MRQSEKDFGIITHLKQSSRHLEKRLNDLDYADDIAQNNKQEREKSRTRDHRIQVEDHDNEYF